MADREAGGRTLGSCSCTQSCACNTCRRALTLTYKHTLYIQAGVSTHKICRSFTLSLKGSGVLCMHSNVFAYQ